jgi:PadR family transcriptional regulator PadR
MRCSGKEQVMPDLDLIDKKFQKDLNAGIASIILLKILNQTEKPMYGYQIATLIEEGNPGDPLIKQGTLYPVLHSLEDNGLLLSEVEPSVTGPPRRYYTITQSGRQALGRWAQIWERTKTFVESTLSGGSHGK